MDILFSFKKSLNSNVKEYLLSIIFRSPTNIKLSVYQRDLCNNKNKTKENVKKLNTSGTEIPFSEGLKACFEMLLAKTPGAVLNEYMSVCSSTRKAV